MTQSTGDTSGTTSGSGTTTAGSGTQTSSTGNPGNAPSTFTDKYSGFGRPLGADPGEGDNGMDKSGLPFGVRPTSPVNRDMNGYGVEGQSTAYLGNPDAAAQADNVAEGDIDGLPLPVIQKERQEAWNDYHDAQRTAAEKADGSGVGHGG